MAPGNWDKKKIFKVIVYRSEIPMIVSLEPEGEIVACWYLLKTSCNPLSNKPQKNNSHI